MTMASSVLSDEARKFCQTTSVRAWYLTNSQLKVQHTWAHLVDSAAFIFWHLAVIFNRFRSYPVNAVISQSVDGESTTFPDVTVCNLKRLTINRDDSNEFHMIYNAFNETITSKEFKIYMEKSFPMTTYYWHDSVDSIIGYQKDPYVKRPNAFFNLVTGFQCV